jgi:Peptidase A4 family
MAMAVSVAPAGQSKPKNVSDETIGDLQKRFVGFPVPDGLFDPSTASPALLREYGLPPRPDPNSQPLLRQVWDRGFGAPLTLKEFQFDGGLVEATNYRLHFRQADELPFAETRFETSLNWSGAYIAANRDQQFLQIWGVWRVPENLRLPPASSQGPIGIDYMCSNWIGLDGQRLYFDSSLPQIGTSSTLPAGGGPTTAQAWTQWWARGNMNTLPVPLGLAVAPGNQVLSVLTAWDPQTVILVMVNLSTMQAQAVEATAPMVQVNGTMATPVIAGATAEWIFERPAIPGETELYNFPDYGRSQFEFCVAVEGESVDIFSLFGGLPQDLQGARLIRMFEVLPNPARTAFISMPRKLDNTSVRLRYGGFPG